jgi:bifunctional UDP-N-acetylglucosamine pyrophosphorylase/glucosamine-1-phosphate N-acetyltransferase
LPVQALVMEDMNETIGINTRVHLAEAEAAMRKRINEEHMLKGVTLIDPDSTYIDAEVSIGRDTVIWPGTYLFGKTSIGAACQIGPNAHIRDTQIGDDCKVLMAVMERAVLEDRVDVGPFARLRKGAHLCKGVHMGNFGEIKDSTLGPGVKMGHFSYIGNAQVGSNTNIGAGTITCNYDGEKKHPTEIGEDAFIGSDTMLVAPVKLGDGARTGAGAVVTKNVPDDTLVVGMPARAIRKLQRKPKKDGSNHS